MVSETDIGIFFGGGKNTHYLGVLALLENRIVVPAASTGGAAADLFSIVQSRFDSVFQGRIDHKSFADLADLNSSSKDVAEFCLGIVRKLMRAR